MKVGDLVRYGSWYEGSTRNVGIILEQDQGVLYGGDGKPDALGEYFLVAWGDDLDWEGIDEIEVINGDR